MFPLTALTFPMVPNIEEVGSKMFIHEDSQTVSGISSEEDSDSGYFVR